MEDQGFTIADQGAGIISFAFTRSAETDVDSLKLAQDSGAAFDEILKNYGDHEALVLVQLTETDGVVSKAALQTYADIMKHPKIMRMAIYGGHAKYRHLAKLVLPFTNFNMIQVFANKSDAMHWLVSA